MAYLFKDVQFRGNTYHIQAWENGRNRAIFNVRIVNYIADPSIIEAIYNRDTRISVLSNFFYPAQTVEEMDLVYDHTFQGNVNTRNTFVKDVMCILKMIAVHFHMAEMNLHDASTFPDNDYKLGLNAFKKPYVSYYGFHHGFFHIDSLEPDHTDTNAIMQRANETIEENRDFAREMVPLPPETVETIVTRYYNFLRHEIVPDPRNPLTLPQIANTLNNNSHLATIFTKDSWVEFQIDHFALVPIPFSSQILHDTFVISVIDVMAIDESSYEPPDLKSGIEHLILALHPRPHYREHFLAELEKLCDFAESLAIIEPSHFYRFSEIVFEYWIPTAHDDFDFFVPRNDPIYVLLIALYKILVKNNASDAIYYFTEKLYLSMNASPDEIRIYDEKKAAVVFQFIIAAFFVLDQPSLDQFEHDLQDGRLRHFLQSCKEQATIRLDECLDYFISLLPPP